MYLYFLFYTTMSECMIFYGPTVPEINYSILYSTCSLTVMIYRILTHALLKILFSITPYLKGTRAFIAIVVWINVTNKCLKTHTILNYDKHNEAMVLPHLE